MTRRIFQEVLVAIAALLTALAFYALVGAIAAHAQSWDDYYPQPRRVYQPPPVVIQPPLAVVHEPRRTCHVQTEVDYSGDVFAPELRVVQICEE